ncbi:transmembrane inner ear expressed protein [Periplaneta americana]|uniref:transmembrane inner ear expressed protein n=1 Tax=Periplaneta americana TaxID=6978 RepID=UPI0037E7CE80
MATCTADADDKECSNTTTTESEWLEQKVAAGFRVWQIIFLCIASLLALVILLCCCIRFRIPRTKQEIEADYVRKKLTKKFKKQLHVIQNSEMDDMDFKRALDRVRAEIRSDTDSLAHSEALSGATLSSGCCHCPTQGSLQVPKTKSCDVTTRP